MKNVLIFGASGHGSVVLDILLRSQEFRPVGFVDSFIKKGTKKYGYEVLGDEFDLPNIIGRYQIYGGIIAVGDNWVRRKLVLSIERMVPGFNYINAIHPSAILGRNVFLGKGNVIMPGVVINSNSSISDHCILNTRASVGHDGLMSPYSSLAPGVSCGGNMRLGSGTVISLGSIIIENVEIGSWSIVGAGSLVLNNIPEKVVAFGSPAKVIRRRNLGEPYLSGTQRTEPLERQLNNTA